MSHAERVGSRAGGAVLEAPDSTVDAPAAVHNILLVDSVRLFLKLEQTLLARREYRLITATTGAGALEIIAAERLDLVVMDHVLPDLSGDEIVRAVRMDPTNARTPVLLVTARGVRENVERCLRAGCNSFLFKPVTAGELQVRVRELLDVPMRRHVRTLVRLAIGAASGEQFFFGTTVNLSESGVLLETDSELNLGDCVDLRFFLPGDQRPLVTGSRIVRRAEGSAACARAFGVLFQGMSDDDKSRIRRFVDETSQSASA
jgi:DNA-binding response OmpR family regulator